MFDEHGEVKSHVQNLLKYKPAYSKQYLPEH